MKNNAERMGKSRYQAARVLLLAAVALLAACARMGSPDGGWYDETPPRVVGASPGDKATGVTTQNMAINFDEYIKVDNPTEKVVVSPPQLEMPEIQGAGRQIKIHLLDSLKPNTTYTVDFGDAISDNNEGNPMGNYTYSFSTGDHIDTLEVSGYVVEAENLEPVKGMLVGLHSNLDDSAFTTEPFLRVSRTDSRGHFVIKGIAAGDYRVFALNDVDRNYLFNQKSEKIAFNRDIITPSSMPDVRQDTIWRDSLHIDSLVRVPYTHFLPDNIVLRAFTEKQTERYLLKQERKVANKFTLFYSLGADTLPTLRGLDFDHEGALLAEPSVKGDTIDYWIRDSLLINRDTLTVELTHFVTDTAGVLTLKADTLTLLSKEPYEKRMKLKEKEISEWKKKQEKAEKRGQPVEEHMPEPKLEPRYLVPGELDPDRNPRFSFDTPLEKLDTAAIHLYSKRDTLWYRAPFLVRPAKNLPRTYELLGEWRPDVEYSLEIDTLAFIDIYGLGSHPYKQGFKVRSTDEYATLLIPVQALPDTAVVVAQLLNQQDKVVKETRASRGTIEFFYLTEGTYFMRIYIDDNKNGQWDTGDYAEGRQAETVYYYPEAIECKKKWDVMLPAWNPTATDAAHQKPQDIVQQKAEKAKTIRRRNYERAKQLGIEYIQENIGKMP